MLGRFISADSIEYLDPETLGGLNLYAYCGNNPIMQIDETGTEGKWWQFWNWDFKDIMTMVAVATVAVCFAAAAIFTGGAVGIVLMSVGLGILGGATSGAKEAFENGTSISGGIWAGAIKGGAIGLASGLGIIAGAVGGLAWGISAAVVSIGANFLAGVAAYNIECQYNNWDVDSNAALESGANQAVLGLLSFGAGCLIGAAGFFNVPGERGLGGFIKFPTQVFLKSGWWINIILAQMIKFVVYEPFKRLIDKNKKR